MQAKRRGSSIAQRELAGARPMLEQLGFILDTTQVHTGGERYLMSGHKLVLTGRRTSDNKRVVIKVSSYAKRLQRDRGGA